MASKISKWIKINWWIVLILSIVALSLAFSIIGKNEVLNDWAETLSNLLTPVSIILGLVLGYPLLKKKLTETYVARQFDVMDNANRITRAECLKLQDKYMAGVRSKELTLDFVTEARDDLQRLWQSAIDAAPDVYRYIYLVYQSLKNLEKYYSMSNLQIHSHYQEELSTWLNGQLHEIYHYSKSVGVFPSGATISRHHLNKRLDKFVSGNSFEEIENLNRSVDYYHHSAMLVMFYGKNKAEFNKDNLYFYLSCFEVAPSLGPFARLMYNERIYFPPLIRSKEPLLLHHGELYLIGYSKMMSAGGNGEEHYYVCTYANISNVSFVEGLIHDVNSLSEYEDGYLGIGFSLNNISDFRKRQEFIQYKISTEEASHRYIEIGRRLRLKLKEEIQKA